MFAAAQRTTDAFILGRFDMLPSDGFSNGVGGNDAEPPQFSANGTNCPAPTIVPDNCGSFEQACTPLVDETGDAVTQSFKSTYQYCGGKDAGDFTLGSAGWYSRTYTRYSDTACTDANKQVMFQETGTMNTGKEATTPGEGAVGFQRWAPATTVTAYGDYITTISLACACSGTWRDGVPRRLTQCRTQDGAGEDCKPPGWYGNVALGQPAYGVLRRLTDNGQDKDEIQFSNPSMDNQAGPSTSYIDGQFSAKLQNTDSDCPFTSPSYDFCGTWTRDCSAEEFSADSTTMILMAGEGENDGQMLMYKQYFNPDTACDEGQVQLTIEARGYYSKMVVDDQHPGVLVGYKQILVTATDQGDMVDALNDPSNGCPCGGTWEAGVKRTLTQCPADTCPGNEIFGAGTLGTPGYGLMQITGGKLQMSVLQTTEADGIYPNGRYELSAFPFELDAACEPAEPEATVCGSWTQPCQSDGAANDVKVDFFSYEYARLKNTYSLNRTDYTPGTGCDDTPVLTVTQSGTLVKTGVATAVANGISVELTPATMTITPFTAEIVSRLAGVCACGVTWTVGQAQTFTGPCPANTCTDTSWLRQPVGGSAYGSMRHTGESLRMTEFDADKVTGYQNDFQPFDYALTLLDSEPCERAWRTTTTPTQASYSGSRSGSGYYDCLSLSDAFIGGGYDDDERCCAGTCAEKNYEHCYRCPTKSEKDPVNYGGPSCFRGGVCIALHDDTNPNTTRAPTALTSSGVAVSTTAIPAASAASTDVLPVNAECDPRNDFCDQSQDLQCDSTVYACRYQTTTTAGADIIKSSDSSQKTNVGLIAGAGASGAFVLLAIVIVCFLRAKAIKRVRGTYDDNAYAKFDNVQAVADEDSNA